MKKWFITFCALGLLSTQVSTADAAERTEEKNNYSVQSYVKVIKWDHDQYEQILNKLLNNFPFNYEASVKDFSYKLVVNTGNQEKLDSNKTTKPVDAPKPEGNTLVEKEEVKEEVKTPSKPVKPVEEVKKEEPVATPAPQTPVQNNTNTTKPTAKPAAPVENANSTVSAFEKQVVELTNAERAKAGLAPLQMDTPLMAVAREKSADMSRNNYFSHTSPTYGSPFDQMKAAGISYNAAGENIAQGQKTPQQVVQAWMNSEGHRANILNGNFTHIGVGYVADGNYWTQQFIKK